MAKKRLPFYSFDRLMSHNGTYNFVCGGRGIGKSYGAKKIAIRKAIDKGEEFIYLRRYKTELAPARDTFFSDIKDEFPEYDFRVDGGKGQCAPIVTRDEKKRHWITIGYFISLSTAANQKSVSFPKVKRIIYDEFIIEKGVVQYLRNEAKVFNDFYSTVDRYRDQVIVLFLANAVSINNPYFLAYDIKPDEEGALVKRKKLKNGKFFLVAHFPDEEDFQNAVMETNFGQFIEGTEYADYAVANVFQDNNDHLIKSKESTARYLCTIETNLLTFSVWQQTGKELYVQKKRPTGGERIFTMVHSKMREGVVLLSTGDDLAKRLRTAFNHSRVWFDDQQTRNSFIEIFKGR